MAAVTISSGETVSSQSFTDGTNLVVAYGGTSTSNVIGPGSTENVSGFSFGDTVSGRQANGTPASLLVASGALVSGAHILAGATFSAAAGATVYGVLFSGVSATDNGGLNAATVAGGATVRVSGGVIGGTVTSGGTLDLAGLPYFGYGATGVTVSSGGSFSIGENSASGTILSGGSATVTGQQGYWFAAGVTGQAVGTQILAGGFQTVSNYGMDLDTVIGSGGTDEIQVAAGSMGVVISGGTLQLDYDSYVEDLAYVVKGTAQEEGAITFAGSGGALRDNGPVAPSSVISGFNATDHIVLAGVAYDPNATMVVQGDDAVVSAGGQSYVLDIVGASSLALTFGVAGTGANIEITAANGQVACYCAGTAITTADGERPVETIAPGDLVITADGRAEPVIWVGQRSYAGRFLQRQPHLLPVRIRAGALGRRLPRRDLLVSPNHALLLDGVLVPAQALIDGHRIIVERSLLQVEYYHLELARHDVILAEGAAAETFLDDDSRGMFQTASGRPGAAGAFCAPRLTDGTRLEAIRRRLAA